jgi:DNA-binding response OmpR family regulator
VRKTTNTVRVYNQTERDQDTKMDKLPHIVLLEDDRPTLEMYNTYLSETGLKISTADSCSQARELLKKGDVDLAVIDLNLPDGDGIELLKEIRHISTIPVIVVTSREDEIDKIVGLELGADDYLVKPVSPRELRLRAGNIIKRSTQSHEIVQKEALKSCAGITLDMEQRQAILNENEYIDLTNGEFELLSALFENPERPISRQYLLDRISGYTSDSQSRSIDTLVYRLRSKLRLEAGKVILTVHGFGYKLVCNGNK